MRHQLILAFALLGLIALPSASAQQPSGTHYVVLYAHASGDSLTLNALSQWSGQRASDVSNLVAFRLVPALGDSVRIDGGVTFTVYLRSNTRLFGSLSLDIAELRSSGDVINVPGVRIESPVSLEEDRPLSFTLGVGIVQYEFLKGSSILLRVRVEAAGSGTPYLVYDSPQTPTSLRLPVIAPLRASISMISGRSPDIRVVQTDPGKIWANVNMSVAIRDAFGVYRLATASATLTASNDTSFVVRAFQQTASQYDSTYNVASQIGIGRWKLSLDLRDVSGDSYTVSDILWVAPFNKISINVGDSSGTPLANTTITVSFYRESWSSVTNQSGWIDLLLPSSEVVGPLNLSLTWRGINSRPLLLSAVDESTIFLKMPLHDVKLRISTYGVPLPATSVTLIQETHIIAQKEADLSGGVVFERIPAGNYTLRMQYLFSEHETALNVNNDDLMTVEVPLPRNFVVASFLLVVVPVTYAIARTKRGKRYPQTFDYLDRLTGGGLPEACFVVIAGNAGSGKTVLLESLAAEHSVSGPTVFVTNAEYPSRILEGMNRLGIETQGMIDQRRFFFIDAYSAMGGMPSAEKYQVASHTDLTGLGLNISKCIGEAGPSTDVYFDSLNPLLGALRTDFLLNFLQAVAAKVKASNGKLCVTVGTGVEKSDMIKLEEASDCVIETQLQEVKSGQRKRLRIKKLRGKPYVDKWIEFQVELGKGIIFLSKERS